MRRTANYVAPLGTIWKVRGAKEGSWIWAACTVWKGWCLRCGGCTDVCRYSCTWCETFNIARRFIFLPEFCPVDEMSVACFCDVGLHSFVIYVLLHPSVKFMMWLFSFMFIVIVYDLKMAGKAWPSAPRKKCHVWEKIGLVCVCRFRP